MSSSLATVRELPTGRETFIGTLRAWSNYAQEDLKPTSVKRYRYWLLRFPADTGIDPVTASLEDLIAWLNALAKQGPTRSIAKRSLRHFYRWLQISKRREDNPGEGLPKTRKLHRVPHYLSEDELTRLVYTAACHNPEWAWSILFIFGTGCRVGEATNLRTEDVDLGARTALLRDTKNGWDRLAQLGPSAFAAAEALMDGRPTLLGVRPGAVWNRLKNLARLADIREAHVHPHALRHTAATTLLERAALLLVDLLGYSAEQAARTLGVRPSTVRALATKGRQALRGMEGARDA